MKEVYLVTYQLEANIFSANIVHGDYLTVREHYYNKYPFVMVNSLMDSELEEAIKKGMPEIWLEPDNN